MYIHIYVTFILLHPPSYNVAMICLLTRSAVLSDDLCF